MIRKQRLRLCLLTTCMCLTLTGCSLAQGLEKDLNIVAKRGNDIYFSSVCNTFNNAVLPDMDSAYIPSGCIFLGWALPGWSFGVDDNDDLYKKNSVVRYNDVKSFAVGDTVTLTSVIVDKSEIPPSYLVLGWYDKVGTSGLDSNIISVFTESLNNYLVSQGASQADIENTVVRGYQGAVADIGTAINADGDVDVLLGVGANITTTGGVACIEKIGGIPMGGKLRYIARLTDNAVGVSVYSWLQTEAAQKSLVAQ